MDARPFWMKHANWGLAGFVGLGLASLAWLLTKSYLITCTALALGGAIGGVATLRTLPQLSALPDLSSLLLVLGWSGSAACGCYVGLWACHLLLKDYIHSPTEYLFLGPALGGISGGATSGIIGGAITAGILQRVFKLHWRESIIVFLGWASGGLVGGGIAMGLGVFLALPALMLTAFGWAINWSLWGLLGGLMGGLIGLMITERQLPQMAFESG